MLIKRYRYCQKINWSISLRGRNDLLNIINLHLKSAVEFQIVAKSPVGVYSASHKNASIHKHVTYLAKAFPFLFGLLYIAGKRPYLNFHKYMYICNSKYLLNYCKICFYFDEKKHILRIYIFLRAAEFNRRNFWDFFFYTISKIKQN